MSIWRFTEDGIEIRVLNSQKNHCSNIAHPSITYHAWGKRYTTHWKSAEYINWEGTGSREKEVI